MSSLIHPIVAKNWLHIYVAMYQDLAIHDQLWNVKVSISLSALGAISPFTGSNWLWELTSVVNPDPHLLHKSILLIPVTIIQVVMLNCNGSGSK